MFATSQYFNKYFIYVLWVLFLLFKANEYCLDLWNNQLGQILEDANRMAIYQSERTRHIKKEQLNKDQDNTHLLRVRHRVKLYNVYYLTLSLKWAQRIDAFADKLWHRVVR